MLGIDIAVRTFYGDFLLLRVDGGDFRAGADIDIESAAEGLGGLHEEAVAISDGATDVVGESAIGIGDMLSLLEEYDLIEFGDAAYSGGGSGSSGHSAYDDVSHMDRGWGCI